MKAISLWQPFASAIFYGFKHFETRHWLTNYRGPLAIHAAKIKRPELSAIATLHGGLPDDLPYGAIIGTCDLVTVIPIEQVRLFATASELHFGDFNPGRFAWVLDNIRSIKPIPCKGRQGFFNVELK